MSGARRLGLAVAAVAGTVALTGLWIAVGFDLYAQAFAVVAGAAYDALGLERAVPLARERYVNAIPFVALVALTPRLGWRRRALGLAGGVAALFAANVALNATALYLDPELGRYPAGLSLVSDTLPFVLWAAVARDWLREFAQRPGSASG